ncbi:MAG: hypothetical protein ABMA00_09325 [Gemmatimonas sp.]
MRVEIVELLLCPAAHASSPLVTVAHRRDGERLIEATLGCSVCGAEYALRDGVVYLGARGAEPSGESAGAVDPLRLAALLGLSEPGARVALCGTVAAAAESVEPATGAVCVVINAKAAEGVPDRRDHILIGDATAIPLAGASLHGVAVDTAHIALLSDAARVVRQGGRVVAPAHAPVPEGCRELARDEREWVAEVVAWVSAPITVRTKADRHSSY